LQAELLYVRVQAAVTAGFLQKEVHLSHTYSYQQRQAFHAQAVQERLRSFQLERLYHEQEVLQGVYSQDS
jgi:hypothetical protein